MRSFDKLRSLTNDRSFFEALLQDGRLDVESRLAFTAMAHAFLPMIPTGYARTVNAYAKR